MSLLKRLDARKKALYEYMALGNKAFQMAVEYGVDNCMSELNEIERQRKELKRGGFVFPFVAREPGSWGLN